MTDRTVNVLILLSALGSGLIAGVFFAFSSFVMGALGRLPAPQGIASMQSINIVVINPVFMTVFLGTAALCAVLAYWAGTHWGDPHALWVMIGAVSCLAGSLLVTMAFNVPLNNALAVADPASAQAASLWANYLGAWNSWNHLRGLAAFAASTAFIIAQRS